MKHKHPNFIEFFSSDARCGELSQSWPFEGHAHKRSADEHSQLAFHLGSKDGKYIDEVRYQVIGPPEMMACCAWLAQRWEGCDVGEAGQVGVHEACRALGVAEVAAHRVRLVIDTGLKSLETMSAC